MYFERITVPGKHFTSNYVNLGTNKAYTIYGSLPEQPKNVLAQITIQKTENKIKINSYTEEYILKIKEANNEK
jgi:hypothetical protein